MNSEKSLRIAFVIISLGFLWTTFRLSTKSLDLDKQTEKLQKVEFQKDSLQHVCDSLHDENFPCQIELGRYQVAYRIFSRRDPQGAEIFGTIISNETE